MRRDEVTPLRCRIRRVVIKNCANRLCVGRFWNEKATKMTELLTSAQMRAIEAAAIASGEVTGLELMERAGRGVVEAVLEEWPELAEGPQRAVVLCGPGNNGGDGFVVARLLKERGWKVEVFLYGTPEKMPPDARVNYERWLGMGEVLPLDDQAALFDRMMPFVGQKARGQMPRKPLLVVDALFGIGLKRSIGEDSQSLAMVGVELDDLRFEAGPIPRIVSVDVPSGLCADSGRLLRTGDEDQRFPEWEVDDDPRFVAFMSDLTVTFHAPKRGHFVAEGPRMCGKLAVVDIGLPPVRRRLDIVETVDGTGARSLGKYRGHKFRHGHALILSGLSGRGGAARLSARGALRIGAGLVTLGCPSEAIPENAARLDAVMLRPLADGAALGDALTDQRITALCLGPALGTGAREADVLRLALGAGRALVLDADALTLLARDAALFGALPEDAVLTPHAGEFARLFPDIAEKLAAPATRGPAYSKVDATREAAKRAGCVVLYKGADTVIAAPDGRCAINSAHYDREAPWLATAGSGDVLAGFIAGLLARDFKPFDAACTAAWLHVECARSFGPGLIAEDLPDELPKVFRALGL